MTAHILKGFFDETHTGNSNPIAVVFKRVIQTRSLFQARVKIQINNPNTRTQTRLETRKTDLGSGVTINKDSLTNIDTDREYIHTDLTM